MTTNTLKLRDHAIGALAVSFAASVATLLMMAKVGPEIFTQLTLGMAVVTMLAVAASACMLAVLILKKQW